VVAAILAVAAWANVRSRSAPDSASPSEPFVGGDLHSLVADPTKPGRLFVGGHQAVAVSDDAGHTWRPVTSLDNADAMGWALTTSGIWQGGHPGLHRSRDGVVFTASNDGLPATDIHALGGTATVLYAASPAAGVLESSDQGRTWEIRTSRAGQSFMGRMLVDPTDDRHVMAPDMAGGVAESHDGGKSWRMLGSVEGGAMWVSWPGGDPKQVIASGRFGATVSRDAGRTWTRLSVPGGTSIVEASPTDASTLYAAAWNSGRAQVSVSHDAGATWARA